MSPELCIFHQAVQPLYVPFASLYLQKKVNTQDQLRADSKDPLNR